MTAAPQASTAPNLSEVMLARIALVASRAANTFDLLDLLDLLDPLDPLDLPLAGAEPAPQTAVIPVFAAGLGHQLSPNDKPV